MAGHALAVFLFLLIAPVWGFGNLFKGEAPLDSRAIAELRASEAVELLCSRKITAVQYAEALLNRAEQYSCVNGFAFMDSEKVMEDAKAVDNAYAAGEDVKPLCGLAFAVKDNIDVLGYPTAAGTPALEGKMPCNSSTLVTRLLDAHGVVLGKTRMHELAEGVTSINVFGGPVLNPYNNTMHVGGSSGGTTAVVAMRMAAAGFCSDTGGSCRIPASVTGVVGFRPSLGCWPAADGIVPMTVSRDTVGVNARSVTDVKLFNDIFSDCNKAYKQVELEGLRIGYPKNFWEDVGKETIGAFDAALNALKTAGVNLVEMDMSLLVDAGNKLLPDILFYTYEMPRELSRYLFVHGYNISLVDLVDKIASPMVKDAMMLRTYKKLDSYPTPADYATALDTYLPQLKALWHSYHDIYDVDVLLVPTTPITARPIDDVEPYVTINGRKEDNLDVYGRMNMIDCPLGVPGLSIPIGLAADSMPIGIMLYGRPGGDVDVLSVGEAIEPLFAATPPPEEEQECSGCTPSVKVVNVTWDGVGTPLNTDTTSAYMLELAGICALKSAMSTA